MKNLSENSDKQNIKNVEPLEYRQIGKQIFRGGILTREWSGLSGQLNVLKYRKHTHPCTYAPVSAYR